MPYKVKVELRTGKEGYRTTWGGHAVPVGTAFHAINSGSFEIRLPDGTEATLEVTNARISGDGESISQRIELTGTGDPPEIIAPPPGH